MKQTMAPRNTAGLTLVELLVLLAVLFILAFLALPQTETCYPRGRALRALSNMKQLHLATQQMALDGTTTGDATLSWPGTNNFSYWATNLVPSYLGTNDFIKLMSAQPPPPAAWYEPRYWFPLDQSGRSARPAMPMGNTNAILVYQVEEQSATNAIFLSSANFTNTPAGGVFNPSANPFGQQEENATTFVVFYKGGYGAVLLPKQMGNRNLVGSYLPLLP